MREVYPEIQSLDASVIAISPEKPDNSLNMVEKHDLPFPVLSDITGKTSESYKIAWSLPDNLRDVYLTKMNRDFTQVNAGAGWQLPVPATFIIDRGGTIRESYVNVDYTKRLEPSHILEVLRSL